MSRVIAAELAELSRHRLAGVHDRVECLAGHEVPLADVVEPGGVVDMCLVDSRYRTRYRDRSVSEVLEIDQGTNHTR